MILKSKAYKVLKWVCLIALPALSVLWYTIGTIWGLPHVDDVTATIAAVETFLGALIGVSSANYYGEAHRPSYTESREEYEDLWDDEDDGDGCNEYDEDENWMD